VNRRRRWQGKSECGGTDGHSSERSDQPDPSSTLTRPLQQNQRETTSKGQSNQYCVQSGHCHIRLRQTSHHNCGQQRQQPRALQNTRTHKARQQYKYWDERDQVRRRAGRPRRLERTTPAGRHGLPKRHRPAGGTRYDHQQRHDTTDQRQRDSRPGKQRSTQNRFLNQKGDNSDSQHRPQHSRRTEQRREQQPRHHTGSKHSEDW